MPHIFGTGLVALDLIIEHRPSGQTLSASGGGTCGNVLAILAHMGWTASWLGAIESSGAGRLVRAEMERAGVCTHLVTDCGSSPAPVFAHHVRLSGSGALIKHWFSNECPHCTRALPRYARPADAWLRSQARQVERADVFFVDRLSAGVLELTALARQNGALVVYEPSASSDSPWLNEMLALTDVVKYSHDRRDVLREVQGHARNHRALWIETLGQKGLRWSRCSAFGRMGELPSIYNPHAVDACGAGDWFTSALLFGLARSGTKPIDLGDGELTRVLQAASRLAAWSCGFLGARGALYEACTDEIFEQLWVSPPATQAQAPLPRPVPQTDICGQCAVDVA